VIVFFLHFDFQKERLLDTRHFEEKAKNKKPRARILPCWAEHLQASAIPAKNHQKDSYKTGC